jgi:hypothetical protein
MIPESCDLMIINLPNLFEVRFDRFIHSGKLVMNYKSVKILWIIQNIIRGINL